MRPGGEQGRGRRLRAVITGSCWHDERPRRLDSLSPRLRMPRASSSDGQARAPTPRCSCGGSTARAPNSPQPAPRTEESPSRKRGEPGWVGSADAEVRACGSGEDRRASVLRRSGHADRGRRRSVAGDETTRAEVDEPGSIGVAHVLARRGSQVQRSERSRRPRRLSASAEPLCRCRKER